MEQPKVEQHPCERCEAMTDATELQVPPHLGPEGDEFWCAECIHAYDPEGQDATTDEEDDA